jgi:hypothetical protein
MMLYDYSRYLVQMSRRLLDEIHIRVYMYSRRDLCAYSNILAYKSRRDLCGFAYLAAGRDLTNCASYDTLAKLAIRTGVYKHLEDL